MTKRTKHTITEDELGEFCFWFHKLSRTSDLTANADLWNAIDELGETDGESNYSLLMENALQEIGIKVKHPRKSKRRKLVG